MHAALTLAVICVLRCRSLFSSGPSTVLFPAVSRDSALLAVCAPLGVCGVGTTKEQEVKRVDKELAHIRKQFGDKCRQTHSTDTGTEERNGDGASTNPDSELTHSCLSVCVPSAIDGYNMRKYTWKLLYMYMLGYDIEM